MIPMPPPTLEYESCYRHIGGPWHLKVLPDWGAFVVSNDGQHLGTYLGGITVGREVVRYWVPASDE